MDPGRQRDHVRRRGHHHDLPSTQVDEVVFILADSRARILVAGSAQASKAANDRERLPDLMAIVVIDGPGDGDLIISMNALRALGTATLIATSG